MEFMEMNDIIIRILTRTNSYEDIIEFAQWLNADEMHRKEFQEIESYWNANTRCKLDITAEDSFKKLQMKIEQSKKKGIKRKRMLFYSGVAASLFIVLAIGFFMRTDIPKEEIRHYICMTEGSTSTFYMEDSTKIILNKNSELSYTSYYGRRERKVHLNGEAYFEVTRNVKAPFIVDMNGVAVRVLGTKFTVNNRKGSDVVNTVLLEGAVRFTCKEQNVLMKPHQKLIFNRNTKNLELTEVDSEQEMAWKDGLFKYRSLSFETLVDKLAADYGVRAVIKNKRLFNLDLKLTGSFEQNASFDKVLDVINRTIKIKWTQEDGVYYIY